MPTSKPNYKCIRCGYDTSRKDLIHKHFYQRKTECQGCYNDIPLTDEIKQYILKNRIYQIKKDKHIKKIIINNFEI